MSIQHSKSKYTPLLSDNPITVNQSTTMQQLSTYLTNYDIELELTASPEMIEFVLDRKEEAAVLKFEKPEAVSGFYFLNNQQYVVGATLLINILVGEVGQEKAAAMIKELGNRHTMISKYIKDGETVTSKCSGRVKMKWLLTQWH